jgi:hypothetical protein
VANRAALRLAPFVLGLVAVGADWPADTKYHIVRYSRPTDRKRRLVRFLWSKASEAAPEPAVWNKRDLAPRQVPSADFS